MPKIKEGGKALNVIIDKRVFDLLQRYCLETGLSKTKAVERILDKHLSKLLKEE